MTRTGLSLLVCLGLLGGKLINNELHFTCTLIHCDDLQGQNVYKLVGFVDVSHSDVCAADVFPQTADFSVHYYTNNVFLYILAAR